MTNASDLPTLPFERPDRFVLSAVMRKLQAETPIAKVRTRSGDEAWLVTGYDEVKALFTDPRLGRNHPKPRPDGADAIRSALSESMSIAYEQEDVDHALMRSRLVPCFSAHRMRALTPYVERCVDELLDELGRSTPPADLNAAFASPLPALVICGLLGVPYGDRQMFSSLSMEVLNVSNPGTAMDLRVLTEYMEGLVTDKRKVPGDDVLSELITAEDGHLGDKEIAGLATFLLIAGHVTTVERVNVGTLLLLGAGQWAALRSDRTLVPAAVEEILRLALVSGDSADGLPRYARADIKVGGVTMKAGDAVLLAHAWANRDERAFVCADRFDIARAGAKQHLAFGYGPRFCIGAALARIELIAAFERLPVRFPDLQLAVPPQELVWRDNNLIGGLLELPVHWSA